MKYLKAPNGQVFTSNHPEYHKDCYVFPTLKAGKEARKEYARDTLRAMLKPGQTVFCTLRSVSSSGMSRRISLHIIEGADIRSIDNLVADATGFKHSDKGGLIATGCGMDMGFHLVYTLGRYLWPNGTPAPHGTRNGVPDSDGGYALKSSWL